MKRLCIYVFYDRKNHVDRYVEYMLKCLRKCVSKLCVICNCTAPITGLECIQRNVDNVFFRENVGFDVGAYKDFFCCLSTWDEIRVYDEVLLVNDTFYGPFYPLDLMFDKMKVCDADFWSVTEHPGGKLKNGKIIERHYQSWFLVIKNTILRDRCFEEFWESMRYPATLQQAIECFELSFTAYFTKKGFKGNSYMSDLELGLMKGYDRNPYIWYSNELIRKAKVPFFKRKALCFHLPGYLNALDALEYIERTTNYDITMIWENIYRLCRVGEDFYFDYEKMEKLYYSCDRIYIYGAGEFGKRMAQYFLYRNWKFEGFLQTNIENAEGCMRFKDMTFGDKDGIILAVGEKYIKEIIEIVRKRIGENRILSPYATILDES